MASLEELAAQLLAQEVQQEIAGANPYLQAQAIPDLVSRESLGLAAKDPTRYGMGEIALTTGLGGLVSGLLGEYGQGYQNTLTDRYTATAQDYMLGNSPTQEQSSLPTDLFSRAKQQGQLFNMKQDVNAQIKQKEMADSFKQDILKSFLDDPRKTERALQSPALRKILGIGGGEADIAAGNAISEATGSKTKTRLEELEEETGDYDLAVDIFKDEKNRESSRKSQDKARVDKYIAEESGSLRNTKSLLDNLGQALNQAKETGTAYPFEETGRRAQLALGDLFGSDDAENRRAARADLESLGVQVAGAVRDIFKGQTTEIEFKKYIESGPTLSKTPEQNSAILDRMQRSYALAKQRLNFLSYATDEGYTQAQAEQMFDNLESEVPTFVSIDGSLEVNPDRFQLDISSLPLDELKNKTYSGIQKKNEIINPDVESNIQNQDIPTEEGFDVKSLVRPVALAGAQFGESALFGIPGRLAAGGQALIGEAGEALGILPEQENRYTQAREKQQAAMAQARQESPVIGGVSDIAGLFASPLNKVKLVKGLFGLKGAKGVAGRAAYASGFEGGQELLARDTGESAENIENAALFSLGVDAIVPGFSKLKGPAQKVFEKLSGIGRADANRIAKGASKSAVKDARKSFTNALSMIEEEFGISAKTLAQGDEDVLIDLSEKATKAIENRNLTIDNIIDEADNVLDVPVEIMTNQFEEAIKKAGVVDENEILDEGINILDSLYKKYGNKITLRQLQEEKKALNGRYKPGQSFTDAKTAITDDIRKTIEGTIDELVKLKKLPKEFKDTIRQTNLEERDLMRLRDAYLRKIPGAQSDDVLTSLRQGGFTTGGAGLKGAEVLGDVAGGEMGRVAAVTAAVLAYSKRIGRPISYALSQNKIGEFLASPEFRQSATGLQSYITKNEELPDFTSGITAGTKKKTEVEAIEPVDEVKGLSLKGENLIKSYEKLKLKPYEDAVGVKTIGYGHTGEGTNKDSITIEEANQLLQKDVIKAENAISRLVKVELTQNQHDALVSFIFNSGVGGFKSSTLLKKLNAGDYEAAANEFPKWKYGTVDKKKVVLNGLVKRRKDEMNLFLS